MSAEHLIAIGGLAIGVVSLSIGVLGAVLKMNYTEHRAFLTKEECAKQSAAQEKLFTAEIAHVRESLERIEKTLERLSK